jgi:predicted transposase/invertase (TIGR01784 family)
VKTDSLFYRLFQNYPSLLFELIGLSVPKSEQYQFQSVEIKQTAFRIDGLFAPPENETVSPIFFVEVQFQKETDFYSRLFAEIFLYLRQYQPLNPWQAVVIYPSRRIDVGETRHYTELLDSLRVSRIYLDELEENPDSLGVSLVQLVVTPERMAITRASELVIRTKQEVGDRLTQQQILDLLETIMVYKLPNLGREEIQEMLGFTEIDVKQTRFYQDVYAEAEADLVIRQLKRCFGQLEESQVKQIRTLEVSRLEDLAIALLDFGSVADLQSWLQ